MDIHETKSTQVIDNKQEAEQMGILEKCLSEGFGTSKIQDGFYSKAQLEQIYYGFLEGADITGIANEAYSPLQLKEIREGLRDGLRDEEVALYSVLNEETGKPVFESQQMKIIKQVLLSGLDAEEFLDSELPAKEMEKRYRKLIPKQKAEILKESGLYHDAQLNVLLEAISCGYDTKQIENPLYEAKQMEELLKAKYENNLRDDQLYILSDVSLSAGKMREIRLGYASGIDAGTYADNRFSESQMYVLRQGKTSGIDISSIITPQHSAMQMQVLTDAIKCNIPTDILHQMNDIRYSAAQMSVIAEAAFSGYDLTRYVNDTMSPEKMRFLQKAMQKGLKPSELRQIASAEYGYHEMQKKLAAFLRMREHADLFMNLRFGTLLRNLWNQFIKTMKHHYRTEELYMHYKLPIQTDLALRKYQFNPRQLTVLEEAMDRGVDVQAFGNPDMSPEKMRLLMEAKAKGIDISLLADPDFNTEQISLCIKALEDAQKHGYDVRAVIHSSFHPRQMKELFDAIKNGIDISILLSDDSSPDYIYQKKIELMEEGAVEAIEKTKTDTVKEHMEMDKNKKTIFGPATERKMPFHELIKAAEERRNQQIADFSKQKPKEKEQAVV